MGHSVALCLKKVTNTPFYVKSEQLIVTIPSDRVGNLIL